MIAGQYLCTHMVPNTVVTDFGNRGGQCQGGRLLYFVKLLYVILRFQYLQGVQVSLFCKVACRNSTLISTYSLYDLELQCEQLFRLLLTGA